MRISFFIVVMSVCFQSTIAVADTVQESATAKPEPPVQIPKQVVSSFWKHLAADEIEQARNLLSMPIANARIAQHPDEFLKELAKQQSKTEAVHVFDSHIIEDLSVVIMGGAGPQYFDGIDIDPVFLKKNGKNEWKIIFARDESDLKENELTDQIHRDRAEKLVKWYNEQEPKTRAEWKKQQKEKSKDESPRKSTPQT